MITAYGLSCAGGAFAVLRNALGSQVHAAHLALVFAACRIRDRK